MCIVSKEEVSNYPYENESLDYPYLVKNCVRDKMFKVSFPLSKNRASTEEMAIEEFRQIAKCFEKHLAESLILCKRTGEVDENGRERYKWLYCCKAENGEREIFPYEGRGRLHLNMNYLSKDIEG